MVVSDDDVRTVHEYLDAVKRGGVKPSNLKCGVLLRMIAEEIGEEKDDLDCLNRQAHYSLLAEIRIRSWRTTSGGGSRKCRLPRRSWRMRSSRMT